MVRFALLLACVLLPAVMGDLDRPPNRGTSTTKYDAKWVKQPLDHFAKFSWRKWNQRYFEDLTYQSKDGPVFIMLEGNAEADNSWLATSFMAEMAKKFKAAMFQLEHRYYGKSKPTLLMTTGGLKWLTVEQALGDVANFIDYLKSSKKIAKDAKVVLFGGSYAGNLAAWARQKYPDVVHAAVASSAPVNLKADFPEFFELVTKAIAKTAGQWCVDNIKTAMSRAEALLKTKEGISTVKNVFRACKSLDLTSEDNINFFFEIQADPFALAVQNNGPTKNGTSNTITDLCENLKGENLSDDQVMEAYGNMLAKRENLKQGGCIAPYSFPFMIFLMKAAQFIQPTPDRQWTYQTCSQLGLYQTGESANQPFGDSRFPLTFFSKVCTSAYGNGFGEEKMAEGVAQAKKTFGDLNASQIIFVNGDLDPWSTLGITEEYDPSSPAILIKGASHCYDMQPSDETDSWAVKSARRSVQLHLNKFLTGW